MLQKVFSNDHLALARTCSIDMLDIADFLVHAPAVMWAENTVESP